MRAIITTNRRVMMPLTVLSRWACGEEQIGPIATIVRPILGHHGAELQVGRIFSGRYAGHFLASVRYPDWERLGRTMHAMAAHTEYQMALAEADRLCELQSRSIVVDLTLGNGSGLRSAGS
jgi:hypothetical protein